MSTIVSTQIVPALETIGKRRDVSPQRYSAGLITALTAIALLIHGYHPYAEDGGLYAAGIKFSIDPTLYHYSIPFVSAYLRYSLFAPIVAGLVHVTHLELPAILLMLHLATIWATLFSVWLLGVRCYPERSARTGAVVLMAACLTTPVAGTSIILMDPYLTARSIAVPCTLFAFAATIDWMRGTTRGQRRCAALLILTALLAVALIHPLMAAFAIVDVLVLTCLLSPDRRIRILGTSGLCVLALLLAALLRAFAPAEPIGYLPVAASRYYWFLSQWRWYEIFGLIAPLCILTGTARLKNVSSSRNALAQMAVVVGSTAMAVALLFAHKSAPIHIVARLQPLRAFQIIYILMILTLGAALGEHLLKRSSWRWALAVLLIGGIMYTVQRNTFPASGHLEWPRATRPNPWQQAFLWIRHNTPRDAFFALDADYTSAHNEDTQSFRAIAERSSLPDFSKDGGETANTPTLTAAWTAGQQAQKDLSALTDEGRITRLRPLNVDWLVLQQDAITGFACPFRNSAVKVCRLP